jgi:hypothetical protein
MLARSVAIWESIDMSSRLDGKWKSTSAAIGRESQPNNKVKRQAGQADETL